MNNLRKHRLVTAKVAPGVLNDKAVGDMALRLAKVHDELVDIISDRALSTHPATKDAVKAVDKAAVQVSRALAGVYAVLGGLTDEEE